VVYPSTVGAFAMGVVPVDSNCRPPGEIFVNACLTARPGDTNPHLEVPELPGLCKDPPAELGGVGLGPVHAAGNVGAGVIEHMVFDAHEPGEASLDTNGTPAPTEGTASVKLAGRAVNATATQPEVLDPWAKSKAWHGLGMPLQKAPRLSRHRPEPPLPPLQKDTGVLGTPPQEGKCKCKCRVKRAPQRTSLPPPQETLGTPRSPPQEALIWVRCRRNQLLQEGTSEGKCRPQRAPCETL